MDRDRLCLLVACFALAACPAPGEGGSGTESEGDDTTGSTGGATLSTTAATASGTMSASTTTEPTTTEPPTSTTEPETTSSSTGDPPGSGCCDPHAGPGCNEPDVQTCVCKTLPECCVFEWDQPCVDAAMMDCAATCMGVETGDETGPSDCELQQIELVASEDGVLDGGWEITDSMIKGTEIVAMSQGADSGTVTFTVPIPCMDTWHIWVRAIDAGQFDSFFVRLDAEPDPPGIFEVECTNEPFDNPVYRWTQLNWRDNSNPKEPAPPCEYLEDPWTAEWDEGDHTIELGYRDSYALSRVIVTNDPDFVPEE